MFLKIIQPLSISNKIMTEPLSQDRTSVSHNMLHDNLSAIEEYSLELYELINETLNDCSISNKHNDNLIVVSDKHRTITTKYQANCEPDRSENEPPTGQDIHLIIGFGSCTELINSFHVSHLPLPSLPDFKLPIYIIETDILKVIASLCTYDICDIVRSGRLIWFNGENAAQKFATYLETNRQALFPTVINTNTLMLEDQLVTTTITILNEVKNKNSISTYKLKSSINKHYNRITNEEWHDIFSSNKRPLRIMGWTSRFTTFLQYCIRDLLEGFNDLGHETYLHIEQSNISRTTQLDSLAAIDEFKPDVIIMLDRFRDQYSYLTNKIPFVNWIQDLLPGIINPENRKLSPMDFTYVFATKWANSLMSKPDYKGHEIGTLQLGVNQDIYYPISNTSKEFDVLYISHLINIHETLRIFTSEVNEFEPNEQESYLIENGHIDKEQFIDAYKLLAKHVDNLPINELWILQCNRIAIQDIAFKYFKIAGISENTVFFKLSTNIDRIYHDICYAIKTRPLISLVNSSIDIRVYGNNWDKVSELSEVSHGPIENGERINIEMNTARISLNNSPGCTLHMRAAEILGSGCFMLSRDIDPDSSDIRACFDNTDELHFFKDENDIVNIVKYWLSNDTKRMESARTVHKEALSIFSYKSTAEKVINSIAQRALNQV